MTTNLWPGGARNVKRQDCEWKYSRGYPSVEMYCLSSVTFSVTSHPLGSVKKGSPGLYMETLEFFLKVRSHQIKIKTDWLQTSFWLTSDSKIGVNGTMLHQCNPTVFYQSKASLKLVRSVEFRETSTVLTVRNVQKTAAVLQDFFGVLVWK